MKVLIQSKTLEVSAALRDFVERQTNRIANHKHRVNSVSVSLENITRKKNDQTSAVARLKIDLPGKKDVIVERRAANLYEAIMEACERAMRYVRKLKEKRLEQRFVRSDRNTMPMQA
jgi:ribosomal subunit interface protein